MPNFWSISNKGFVTSHHNFVLSRCKCNLADIPGEGTKNADKAHPCGAPAFISMVGDFSDLVRTYCCQLVRKSRTNSCNRAGMLYSTSLLIRIWGCIVLKADEGSCVIGVTVQVLCDFVN